MFKYEIGQVLQLRVAPMWRFQVVERIASECSAGEQLYYQGRLYKAGEHYERYHELELEPVPPAASQE